MQKLHKQYQYQYQWNGQFLTRNTSGRCKSTVYLAQL